MLEKLNDIDWQRISHAYGPATDVPDQLRALASLDKKIRDEAYHHLYGNIYHQGTRWSASAKVVPFLFELLAGKQVQEKDRIIHLLIALAIGDEEEYLPFGIDPQDLFKEAEDLEKLSDFERLNSFNFDDYESLSEEEANIIDRLPVLWARNTYNAVAERAETFLEFINSENAAIKIAATYAVAWFPNITDKALHIIRVVIAREKESYQKANIILSLGMLAHYQRIDSDIPMLMKLLSSTAPTIERIAAAIAIATICKSSSPPEVIAALIEFAGNGCLQFAPILPEAIPFLSSGNPDVPDIREQSRLIPWKNGELVSYASLILSHCGLNDDKRIVAELCGALELAKPLAKLTITGALLSYIFYRMPAKGRFVELTPLQQQALIAIDQFGCWKINGRYFSTYGNLVTSFGLPGLPEKFHDYVSSRS
ncbi:MAG: hypothetical protein AB1489_29655 [Acidobacteriota bacterium]